MKIPIIQGTRECPAIFIKIQPHSQNFRNFQFLPTSEEIQYPIKVHVMMSNIKNLQKNDDFFLADWNKTTRVTNDSEGFNVKYTVSVKKKNGTL